MSHPMNEEVIDQIAQYEPDLTDEFRLNREYDMREAADWQLEQVIRWIEDEAYGRRYLHPHGSDFIADLKEAMRP